MDNLAAKPGETAITAAGSAIDLKTPN